jgi:hypothetical protein
MCIDSPPPTNPNTDDAAFPSGTHSTVHISFKKGVIRSLSPLLVSMAFPYFKMPCFEDRLYFFFTKDLKKTSTSL